MKIVQILIAPQDPTWQGNLLGLSDSGETFFCSGKGKWEPYVPNEFVDSDGNALVYKCKQCGTDNTLEYMEENKCGGCGIRVYGHE